VFVQVSDPVSLGFVANLARPGGNVTGFTNFEHAIGGKWLELIKDTVPGVTRVEVILDPDTPLQSPYVQAIEAAAPSFGVELVLAFRTTALVRTAYFVKLLHFRYRNPEKTQSAVTGILLQGPDTSTGRVPLGCRTEKLIMTMTSREWEVATLIAKGLSNKEIARLLNAREGTVKIHLHNIYEKLAIKNRTVLALMTQRVIESGSSEDRKGGAALAEAVAAA
jgi:DNA-binding CsgD family transcriptional regulator